MSAGQIDKVGMPRKGQDPDADGDYDPYDSFEEDRRVRQRTVADGPVVRSSRGRPVKVFDCLADHFCGASSFHTCNK